MEGRRRGKQEEDEESGLKGNERGRGGRNRYASGDDSESGSYNSSEENGPSPVKFFEEREGGNRARGKLFQSSSKSPPPGPSGSRGHSNESRRKKDGLRTKPIFKRQGSAHGSGDESVYDQDSEFRKETTRRRRSVEEDDNNDETHSTSESESLPEVSKTTSALLLAEGSSQFLHGQTVQDGLWNVLVYGEPVHRTEKEKEQYRGLIYVPSSHPVEPNEKLPKNADARYPENEGLFVGKPLSIAPRNKNILEHRLLKEKAFQWFGQDGQLFSFPNPYRPEPIQLFRDDLREDDFNKHIVFVPAKLDPYQEFQLDPKTNYEIVIDIGSLNFTHHYLFSKEHVLAARLELAMQEYLKRKDMKSSERAENKLKALREAIIHTKNAIDYSEGSIDSENMKQRDKKRHMDSISQLTDRIVRYRGEMRRARLERDQSLWDERATLVAVVDAWKQLKALRQDQGYVNTLLKLNIITVNEDHSAEKAIWQVEMKQELQDLKEEYEEEFEHNMARYRAKMKEWLEVRREAKSKSKSVDSGKGEQEKKKKVKKSQSLDSELQDDESSSDSEVTQISVSTKPVPPPAKFDEEETKKAVEKRFKDVRRLPGEPKVMLELSRTSSITSKAQLPPESAREEQRRKATNKTKIELRIRFNRKEVYRSKPRDLNGDFNVFFGLTVPIVVNEWPEMLAMEVIDSGTLTKTLLYEINIPLPNSKTSIDRCHMQKMGFFTEEVVKTSSSGVGSGIEFEILGNKKESCFTSGFMTIRLGWSADKDGNILCPKGFEQMFEKDGVETTPKHTSGSGLQKWSENSQLDPNDPQNARWLDLATKNFTQPRLKKQVRLSREGSGDSSEDFALDNLMDEFDFCTMESIENSFRFRLLQLRDEEVPEFKGVKVVAPFEKDISLEAFDVYERRLKEDTRKRLGQSTLAKVGRKRFIDDDSIYESNRLEKIRQMRLSVLQLFENSLKHITFEDIVVEEQMPDIGTLGLNLMTLFQPRRPLRPTRKERRRVQGSSLMDTKINLIVNIVRAFNLPMRKDTDIDLLTTESVTGVPLLKKRNERNGNYSTVKPFVEIWFQRNVCRTTTALGSNPTWNQELQLGLAVPNDDYSPSNLSRMDDYVYLLVYDEVAINLLEDDRRKETDIHQRLEKRWLGSITIPFSTLFANGRIEGTFKINSPPILLGYEAQRMATHFGTSNMSRSGNTTNLVARQQNSFPFNNQKNAFITLFITLQPTVNPSNIFKEESATGETPDMMAHVKSWKDSFQKKFPERFLKPFVMTPDGDTVLCTRFLRAIEPPASLIDSDQELIVTMEDLAHYVSLFPSIRDSTLGITDYGLWFTSDVFVMTPGGGIEDHAVLLACFFLYLNIPCWIVQGNAIPDGPTTYVATSFKDMPEDLNLGKNLKNAVLIWNPCSGEYYNANDNFCPLQKVWAAIGKLNIWVNIYEGERPHQLDWDVGKSRHWSPLFPKTVAESKVPSLQPGSIKYKTPDKVQANSLAQRIERHLKEAFMKWRKTTKTNWNRYCSATLRRLLPKLEETKSCKQNETGNVESTLTIQSSSPTSIGDEHLLELREVMASYQITGFPLQQPYVNMESITETVFATGVHTIDTPDVEFAVAAYAQAYPASVYSVWIYVAALHRRK